MAIVQNPVTLDLSDIQGMITRGYASYFQTAYFFLKVKDASKAKQWIVETLPLVDSADHKKTTDRTLHLAFAADGLKALGLNGDNINTFPIAFREGMNTNNRNRVLGDYGENDPNNWRWGKENNEQILLIFHAKTKEDLDAFVNEQQATIENNGGLKIDRKIMGYAREDSKEPFGFHDGISQPVIKGSGRSGPENDMIETGEFLMGYKNEHGHFPDSPRILRDQGDLSLLKTDANGSGKKDLGHNGTFMVFRQMEQDVDGFWESMENHTKNEDGSVNEEAKIKLASKCIGRWPSGASLVNYPDKDPGGSLDNDDFGYADSDPEGLKCPFGSHLRRNNPRDSFRWYDKKQSLKITRRHRIMRRGRIYERDQNEIGLLFICFNANIELQYEFIQHVWSNNNQMRNTTNDVDIIIGVPLEGNPNNPARQFTVQKDPVNAYYTDWKQYVTIRGGAYYFFPSLSVLKYFTTI